MVAVVRKVLAIVWWYKKTWQQLDNRHFKVLSKDQVNFLVFCNTPLFKHKSGFPFADWWHNVLLSPRAAHRLLLSSSSSLSGTGVNLKGSSWKHKECTLEDINSFLSNFLAEIVRKISSTIKNNYTIWTGLAWGLSSRVQGENLCKSLCPPAPFFLPSE